MGRTKTLPNHLMKCLKKKTKARRKYTLDEIAVKMHKVRIENNGRLPHSFVANIEK